jgi:hypothetical protein
MAYFIEKEDDWVDSENATKPETSIKLTNTKTPKVGKPETGIKVAKTKTATPPKPKKLKLKYPPRKHLLIYTRTHKVEKLWQLLNEASVDSSDIKEAIYQCCKKPQCETLKVLFLALRSGKIKVSSEEVDKMVQQTFTELCTYFRRYSHPLNVIDSLKYIHNLGVRIDVVDTCARTALEKNNENVYNILYPILNTGRME